MYLCSPETAAASALMGVITDPRTLDMTCPEFTEPATGLATHAGLLIPPADGGQEVPLVKGPNIAPLPPFDPLPDRLEGPVLLKLGNDVSTDEILPAGARVLPFRSNIPEISRFTFAAIDESYYERAKRFQQQGSFVVGGENYGQGSSREHAALAPRFLGLRVVLAKSFARIHWQNLINFGILPLQFVNPADWEDIQQDDVLVLEGVREALQTSKRISVRNKTRGQSIDAEHSMSARQVSIVLAGSLISVVRDQAAGGSR